MESPFYVSGQGLHEKSLYLLLDKYCKLKTSKKIESETQNKYLSAESPELWEVKIVYKPKKKKKARCLGRRTSI